MVDAQIKMECTRCKNKFPFMTMSYGKDKNSLLCQHCKSAENPVKEDSGKKIKYVCESCKFKFGVKPRKKNIICPYCGKKEVVPQSERSADNLLRESILD